MKVNFSWMALGLSLLLSIPSVKGQDGCSNHELMKSITSDSFNKFAKTYWAKRCACESGNITSGTWDYSVEIMNTMYEMYQKPGFMDKYTGLSFPIPDKRMQVSDCKSSVLYQATGMGETNCGSPAFSNSEDPQQYGNAFMRARCLCKEGVPTEEQAKNLEREMRVNYDNAIQYYGQSRLNLPRPLSADDCPLIDLSMGETGPGGSSRAKTAMIYTGNESSTEILRDKYIETFSPTSTYNAYASGMNVKRLGEAMVQNLSRNLDQIGDLIESSDPNVILNDFNQKVGQIQNLEANFNEQFNTYSFETGVSIGNDINNQNYEGAMLKGLGQLNSALEKKEAEERLAARKAALYQQRLNQMSKIYWKAVDYNKATQSRYLERAAFSEKPIDEKYNLAFVDNLSCHNNSMASKFSTSHTGWLKNNCPPPVRKQLINTGSPNVKKEKYYSNLAEKKMEVYRNSPLDENQEPSYPQFREAAIHFLAKSISLKPSARKYATLASYYRGKSNILELNNYLVAQQIDSKALSGEELQRMDDLRKTINYEIKEAIYQSDQEFITAFLGSGFDDRFRPDNQDILEFLIRHDRDELIPVVLNSKTEGLEYTKKQDYFEQAIVLSIAYDSPRCLSTLLEAGLSLDFKVEGKSPVDLMHNLHSRRCLTIYLRSTGRYQDVSHFYQGIALITGDEAKVGAITELGDEIIPPIYRHIRSPRNGFIVVQNAQGLYGAFDYTGKNIIPVEYNYLGDYVNGLFLARVQGNPNYGFINASGATQIPFEFEYAEEFGKNYGIVGKVKGSAVLFAVIDRQGNLITRYKYNQAKNLNSHFIELNNNYKFGSETFFLFPDLEVYDSESFSYSPFSYGHKYDDEHAVLTANHQYAVVKNEDEELVELYHRDKVILRGPSTDFQSITLHNNLVRVLKTNKDCFILDSTGTRLLLDESNYYYPLENGLIAYRTRNHVSTLDPYNNMSFTIDGIINQEGGEVLVPALGPKIAGKPYLAIVDIYPDNINVANHSNHHGAFEYKKTQESKGSKLALFRALDAKQSIYRHGFIDQNGRWAIPPIYKDAKSFYENIGLVSTDGEDCFLVDDKGRILALPEKEFSLSSARFSEGILVDSEEGYYLDKNARRNFDYYLSEQRNGFNAYLFEYRKGTFRIDAAASNGKNQVYRAIP